MKLPQLAKDKNTNIAIYVGIALIVIFVAYKAWQRFNVDTDYQIEDIPGANTSSTAGTTTTAKVPVTNSTILKLTSPRMKNERVQWVQNAYNKYAKLRKTYGKTPDWATITEDGDFGTNTQAAVYRLMGEKSTTWEKVKTRTDYLTKQLTNGGLNIAENQSENPYGWNF